MTPKSLLKIASSKVVFCLEKKHPEHKPSPKTALTQKRTRLLVSGRSSKFSDDCLLRFMEQEKQQKKLNVKIK